MLFTSGTEHLFIIVLTVTEAEFPRTADTELWQISILQKTKVSSQTIVKNAVENFI